MNLNPVKMDKLVSHSPEETILMGSEFAVKLKPGDIVGLYGDLGTGKTQFVKGICNYFEIKDNVSSPTFIIVNEYPGRNVKINHFDLYRVKNISELNEIGFENYINEDSICLIEWADLAEKFLDGEMYKVSFEYGERNTERIISFKGIDDY